MRNYLIRLSLFGFKRNRVCSTEYSLHQAAFEGTKKRSIFVSLHKSGGFIIYVALQWYKLALLAISLIAFFNKILELLIYKYSLQKYIWSQF